MPTATKGYVRSKGPRRATKKDLIANFDKLMRDNKGGIVDFPLRYIEDHRLKDSLKPLRKSCNDVVSEKELYKGARLAKGMRPPSPCSPHSGKDGGKADCRVVGHQLDLGLPTSIPLNKHEKAALEIQRSPYFWKEPKELLLTLFACSLASLTQGWDQAASGNLLWPQAFGLTIFDEHPATRDVWIFAGVQSIPWFAAAILGSYLSDPLSEYIGRRGALFVAAMCSFTSMVGASRANTWQAMFCCRIVLGIGIGGKASVVPILESEITPSSKRGRLLVGWQVFVAMGLCCGYIASYIFRDNWRHQVLSGAIPAFALLTATWASCESPRWQIIQGQHSKAFTTLVRLRKERILAAKELCSIYYQIQAERWIFSGKKITDEEKETEDENPFYPELPRTSYGRRLVNHFTFPRIRRAAIAAMIVMLSQQFSGINIIAFLATNFFSTADLRPTTTAQAQNDSYKLAIGWAAVNTIASVWAYFLVENKEEPKSKADEGPLEMDDYQKPNYEHEDGLRDDASDMDNDYVTDPVYVPGGRTKRLSEMSARIVTFQDQGAEHPGDDHYDDDDDALEVGSGGMIRGPKAGFVVHEESQQSQHSSRRSSVVTDPDQDTADDITESDGEELFDTDGKTQLRGRRFLLLTSLAGGAISLLITSLCFLIPRGNSARLPIIALFIMIFTIFYSIGAGAMAFLYCAEIFPNEGREIGMSWSTFWNFLGVGILLLFVPFGIDYSHGKLLGIFAGLNVFALILVYFFVPSTNQTATLEDMSYIFGRPLRQHAFAQLKRLIPGSKVRGPRTQWKTGLNEKGSVSTMDMGKRGSVGPGTDMGLAPDETRLNEMADKRQEVGKTDDHDVAAVKARPRAKARAKDPDQIESC